MIGFFKILTKVSGEKLIISVNVESKCLKEGDFNHKPKVKFWQIGKSYYCFVF